MTQNKVIRTLCSNYIPTLVSQIDDSTGFVRIEKFYLEITLSFERNVCVRIQVFECVVLTGKNGYAHFLIPFRSRSRSSLRQMLEYMTRLTACCVISLYQLCCFLF